MSHILEIGEFIDPDKPNCDKCGTFEHVYYESLCKDCYIRYLEQQLKMIKNCECDVLYNGECLKCGKDLSFWIESDEK